MIPHGAVGKVYRAVNGRNAHGDPIDVDGNVIRLEGDGTGYIGDVLGILMGGLSSSPALARQESSDTSGQLGIPLENEIKVQFGDRILIDSVRYQVDSRPRWNYANSMTTTKPTYAWVSVKATEDG